jgi:phage gpG-like protein
MSKFGFEKMISNMPDIKMSVVRRLSSETQKYFAATFPNQGIEGKSWQEVQRRIKGTVSYAIATRDDRRRKILYGKSGELKRKTADSEYDISLQGFTLLNPLPYATIQNEGGVNGRGAYVPPRPFMIQTGELTRMQLRILLEETGKVWQVR